MYTCLKTAVIQVFLPVFKVYKLWKTFDKMQFTTVSFVEFKRKGGFMKTIDKKEMKRLTSDEIKKGELNILVAFDDYCKNHKLTYFMCGGTLLGAVRHKGFIPWDDDIDVFMPRPDYEKFRELTSFNPIKKDYLTCSIFPGIRRIEYPFMKVIDNSTVVYEKGKSLKKSIGLWIDVFPIDGLPQDENKIKSIYKKNRFLRDIYGAATRSVKETNGFARKVVKFLIKPFAKLYGVKRICKKIDLHSKEIDYETSENVGGILWGYGPNELLKKKDLVQLPMTFEGYEFSAPKNYDTYLSNLYGDYMQLPPEEKRVCHDIIAFKK